MIRRNLIYFRRADLLDDQLEGEYAKANRRRLTSTFDKFCRTHRVKISPEDIVSGQRFMKTTVYLNCWHMDDRESGQMWRSYTQSPNSVVLRSTAGTLNVRLGEHVIISKVLYADETVPRIEYDSRVPFLFKRPKYKEEAELRLLLQLSPDDEEKFGEKGLNVKFEPRSLIDEIILHPNASDQFAKRVRKLAAIRLGGIRVSRSLLPH